MTICYSLYDKLKHMSINYPLMVAKYEAPRTKLTIDWHSNIGDKEINNLVNVHATHF